MKMGIEKAIRGAFGEQFKGVEQLEAEDAAASVSSVDMHLNMLRGAIDSFGGSVEVVSVEEGVCVLDYRGPEAIAMGVAAAIKDQFKGSVKEVVFNMEDGTTSRK